MNLNIGTEETEGLDQYQTAPRNSLITGSTVFAILPSNFKPIALRTAKTP